MTSQAGTVELHELVLPVHANHRQTLFAGQGLQLMAKAAVLAARSLAQCEVVMAGVTSVGFLSPVAVGHSLVLRAWVSRVGRSSMTVCVSAWAEVPGVPAEEVLKGIFDMVAVNSHGRPQAISTAYLNKQENP